MVPCKAIGQLRIGLYIQQRPTAILAGICMAAAGFNLFNGNANSLLQVIGMTVFSATLIKNSQNIFSNTWLFATAWIASSVWWLYIALHDVGGMPVAVSLAAIALLSAGLALYYALAFEIYKRIKTSANTITNHLLFASCWTLAELARAQWFTGFPWSAIGYSHVNTSLSYLAPWTGIYGIGFVAAFASSWLAHEICTQQIKAKKLLAISVVILGIAMPSFRHLEQSGQPLQVNLLQGNISQITKYTTDKKSALEWYSKKMLESQADLTVLPEIAIPFIQHELPDDYWQPIKQKFSTGEQAALIGIPTLDQSKGYGNSAIGLGFGTEQKYDKYHLVPFGEFTPKSLKWFTDMMVNELGEFNRGDIRQPAFSWGNHRLSVNICYEDLFGEELAARFVNTTQIPTVFVNMSNIAWFGNTMVLSQHLDIARMRSLEFQRPTIRATNTGTTAIISAEGMVVKQLPVFTSGSLTGDVYSNFSGITFFAFWAGHWGLIPMWSLCLVLVMLSAGMKWKVDKKTSL
jgi:apolipoprotein N-acyltransferase